MRALNRKMLRDLWRMRGQSLAIIVVIAMGVAAFVMGLGTVDSLEITRKAYYQRYRFAEVFLALRRAPETLVPRIAAIPGVRQVATGIAHNVVLDVPGIDEPINGLLVSAPESGTASLNNLHIRQGRMIRPKATDEVVVTEPFAEANRLLPGSVFFANLKGQRRKLHVVGVALSPEYVFFGVPGTLAPDDRRFGVLWMDREALGRAFDLDGAFNSLALTLQSGTEESAVLRQLDRLLLNYGGVGAYGRKDHISHATLSGEIEQLRSSIHIAAPVFLGVIAFLLNMLMLRYVETEREHIGILKAFGYGNAQVAWQYVKFVLIIVAGGLSLGMGVGAWLGYYVTEIYAEHYHFPFLEYGLRPAILLQAVAVYGLAGLLGAIHGVGAAARLQPAVAMRPASPPAYRLSAPERLGLRFALDQPTRMMLRHIFRWPFRSSMTLLGIAAAIAIFIAPFGISGSVDRMIDTHFFQAERQDLTVSFAQERPRSAIADLTAFPGVMRAEGFRAVLAKIRFGSRERRVTILGRRPENTLTRPLDRRGRPVVLPERGVTLSTAMAEWLGVRTGDYVTLEILQGRRLTRTLPVTAITASYVGLTFFTLNMELDLLNSLMLEGDVISGVNLTMDPIDKAKLYRQLEETPSITGVISHQASLSTMRRLLGETLKLTVINGIFAGAIIFGVIYNNARVSFTERRNEFAALLMLGFGRSDIYYIAIGELLLLTIAAMPLGAVGGYLFSWVLTEGTANELFRIPLHIDTQGFGSALAFALASIALSSLTIVQKIMELDIVEALKVSE